MVDDDFENVEMLRKINKFDLAEECIRQACGYHYWAEKEANAKDELSRAITKLEVAQKRIKLSTKIDPPAPYKGQKLTDAQIDAFVDTRPEIIELRAEIHDKTRFKDLCTVVVRTLDQRKSMLDNLVSLHGRGYFHDPGRVRNGEQFNRSMSAALNHPNQGE